MHYQPSSRLHQPLLKAGKRPLSDFLWQHQPPQQIPQVVGKNAEPQPHLIAAKPVAAQPRHLHRLLALLDPLLCLAALVIEMDHLAVPQ